MRIKNSVITLEVAESLKYFWQTKGDYTRTSLFTDEVKEELSQKYPRVLDIPKEIARLEKELAQELENICNELCEEDE